MVNQSQDINEFSFRNIKLKRFFSSSLSAIRVVLSAYLRLLIILLEILIPACVSSSPAFLMMYSAYKLNKQYCVVLSFYSGPFIIPIIGEKTGLEMLRSLFKVVMVVVQLLSPCLVPAGPGALGLALGWRTLPGSGA